MNDFWPEYTFGTQQDAHEFYEKLIGCLLESLQRNPKVTDMQPFNHLFRGELENTVVCPHCSQIYTNIEVFQSLSVPIKNTITVNQALASFFAPGELDAFRCRSCNTVITAHAGKMSLLSLPKITVVHLKRFTNTGSKDGRPLEVEEEIRLRTYVKHGKILEDKARLIGVVVHNGTYRNGHYYCYTLYGMQWYKIDDMKITRVPVAEVKAAQPYMLFFRAMPRPYIN